MLAEQPLLDHAAQRSLDLGIRTMEFQYNYQTVQLLRSQQRWKIRCLEAARRALHILEHLISDSEEVYNGVVWALLYCPFTPCMVLLSDVINGSSEKSRTSSLEAISKLPPFLEQMTSHHPLAGRLLPVSKRIQGFAEHAIMLTPSTKHLEHPFNDQSLFLSFFGRDETSSMPGAGGSGDETGARAGLGTEERLQFDWLSWDRM